MIAPPEAGLGRRRGWALPHFGTKAEERQSPALLVTPQKLNAAIAVIKANMRELASACPFGAIC
jgi:hypothetical protein